MAKSNEAYVTKRSLRRVAAGVAALAVAYLGISDSHLDFFGDAMQDASAQDVRQQAQAKYDAMYVSLSPADKFSAQYGSSTDVRVDSKVGGNGTLGVLTEGTLDFRVTVNNGCLDKTAYDINGGDIDGRVWGLFVRGQIEGDVPTAGAFAQVQSENQDRLVVSSGNANSVDLVFEGVSGDGPLVPADRPTERILETYGCSTGVSTVELVSTVSLDADGLR